MTTILGLSCFFHDSAAAIVRDGDIVAAAQEERFTRKKHDESFPRNAVDYCLKQAGLTIDQVDYVVYYEKPLTKFERLLETYLSYVPKGFSSFRLAIPTWIKEKLFLRSILKKELGKGLKAPLLFPSHHESHGASAFFPSPFDEAAILTVDGVGEWTTTTIGHGKGNRMEILKEISFPHSLGLLYSAFTYYCGFKVNSGEYKLMGLAPYGKPEFKELILEKLIQLQDDGSFYLNMEYFDYPHGLTMTNNRFHRLFGGPPRKAESLLEQRHMDLAASIQSVTEEVILRLARFARQLTGSKNLVMAGGVALNCVANGVLDRAGIFDSIWVQPAAGDAGGALGAALFAWYQLLEKPRVSPQSDAMKGSFLGPLFSEKEIAELLKKHQVQATVYDNNQEMIDQVASALAEGQIVGWFQGRMEFGPRALGGRSILGDPRSPRMQSIMNLRIKYRESFRPFAPIVLAEHAHEWFDMRPNQESPYMLHVAPVLEKHRVPMAPGEIEAMATDPDLRKRVNLVRSKIPAVTHVDFSARIQTIDPERNPLTTQLLSAFAKRTGVPILVNTSFNVRGEPICCTPQDAFDCFCATEMDMLVLGLHVIKRVDLPAGVREPLRKQYLSRFDLD